MPHFAAGTDRNMSGREIRNRRRSAEIAAEGMVLLKNNGILPLNPADAGIALYGNGARKTVRGGTGSGDVNVRDSVNIEQGLEAEGFRILTKHWLDRYDRFVSSCEEAYGGKIRQDAEKRGMAAYMRLFTDPFQMPKPLLVEEEDLVDTDTAVYVISRVCGEGRDRSNKPGDFQLYDEDVQILSFLAAHYPKLAVLLNVGGVLDLTPIDENPGVGAVLLMSQAGIAGGDALARVLSGKVTPSGHLAATWARHYEDYPAADSFGILSGDVDDTYYKEGIYVGYRYFDTFQVTPAYPFGFGLSYTTFAFENAVTVLDRTTVRLSVTVRNTGSRPGKAVAQVYVSAPGDDKPYQELRGFSKSKTLQAGEWERLQICFDLKDMASYDVERHAFVLSQGIYYVRVGAHSRDTHIAAAIRMPETVVTEETYTIVDPDENKKLTGQLLRPERKPCLYEKEAQEKAFAENEARILVPDITLLKAARPSADAAPKTEAPAPSKMVTAEDVRSGRFKAEELTGQLTNEELATIVRGSERYGGGMSFIGQSSDSTPGAAGETTSRFTKDRGIRNLIMADGPAGVRISRFFAVDQDGNQIAGVGGASFPGIELVTGPQKMEAPEGAVLHYQYCTAIPIGTLLAQTWDMELIEEAGKIVGSELQEFGIGLWLAPGMNIQRNPLCGRNFEYFSEDPFLTGCCAAADVKGVQSYPGVGATIKHFAFNNEEDNRMHLNAHIDERTAREIYLKGFEIAVRRAHPAAVMSSYNLFNGVHTANSPELLTKVLREEWGFDGLVMTDWGTTGGMEMEPDKTFVYGSSDPAQCIRSGNDLIMPGSQKDVDAITKAADEGTLEREALELCAGRVLKAVFCSISYLHD